ncbi:MAG: exodeoxyribonuclease V subunit gamma [Bacteroidota bacterium]
MAKFTVYTHFDLSVLSAQFADDIKEKHSDADLMDKEYVIIQTAGMKKWLALECARINGVFTQVSTLMPKQFIMDIGFKLLGLEEKRSVFERDVLPWALYSSIKDGIEHGISELDVLKSYIGTENSEIKLFTLADKIADIFDQYMLYRHDWLEKWESGGSIKDNDQMIHSNEIWQKYLWNELIRNETNNGIPSPPQYLKQLSEKIRMAGKEEIARLPKRVSVFGLSVLPPQYLNILSQLGNVIDVTLYLQVPTIEYIDKGVSDRQTQKRIQTVTEAGKSAIQEVQTVNRLLRNLAPVSTEFMQLLMEIREEGVDPLYDYSAQHENEPELRSLLKRVQQDVILCKPDNEMPVSIAEKDWSIRVASCYGPIREVEVLHDLLLDCFAMDPSLSPSDILIVTPDIALYGPLVQMVFESAKEKAGVGIPVTISDQSVLSENAVAGFVRDMLDAVSGRFEASRIISLFETVSHLSGNPISANDRDQMIRWCTKSGIRWGYDESSKKKYLLPVYELFSWRYGIDRLIAGVVMDDDAAMSDGFLPSPEVSGSNAALLGRLAEFVHSLGSLTARIGESHTVAEWNVILSTVINNVLGTDHDQEESENETADTVRSALTAVRERAEISGANKREIPFVVLMQSLVDEIDQSSGSIGFNNGKTTVAAMLPMRSIPFRIVAMVGMNHGLFPRRTGQPEFNLIRHDSQRPGDRDVLKGDRYLFLETILAARERLIITWSGFNPGNGSEIPPSNLVDELVSHLNREYCLTTTDGEMQNAGDSVLVKYPLHPFSARYRSSHDDNIRLNTWNRGWFNESLEKIKKTSMFDWELSRGGVRTEPTIDGGLIYDSLADPMDTFLNACRIEQSRKENQIKDSEPFILDQRENWTVRNAILNELLFNDADAVKRLTVNAELPPSAPGEKIVAEHRRTVEHRIQKLRSIQREPDFRSHRVDVTNNGERFVMEIERISLQKDSAVIMDLGRTYPKRRLNIWITHLFLNLELPVRTFMVTLDKTVILPPISKDDAVTQIRNLHELSLQASMRLLPFIIDVSWAFFEKPGTKVKNPDEFVRTIGWKVLKAILGLTYGDSNRKSTNYIDAFREAQNWDEAMNSIPGGEKVFKETAYQVFGMYAKLAEEKK